MENWDVRTTMLLGNEAADKLKKSRVAVFGIGGVGGYVCEALARSGVGALDLIDHDKISPSNINRQIIATVRTVGRYKTDVMKERIAEINPDAAVRVYPQFFLPGCEGQFAFCEYDYIVDAVDTVTAKIALVLAAKKWNVPVISSMGAGNKLDGGRFCVADLYETRVCPLARVMRRELKKRGVTALKVVYSDEEPLCPEREAETMPGKKQAPGSVSFVPSVAGLLAAGEVVRDLINEKNMKLRNISCKSQENSLK